MLNAQQCFADPPFNLLGNERLEFSAMLEKLSSWLIVLMRSLSSVV